MSNVRIVQTLMPKTFKLPGLKKWDTQSDGDIEYRQTRQRQAARIQQNQRAKIRAAAILAARL